jgi:polar amino acid transport system substrate-binding protein
MNRFSIIFLWCFSFTALAQTTELKLGSDVWPPFTNIKGEKSFALEIVDEALSRIGIKTVDKILTFDEVILAIDRGELDGSAALWSNQEREKKYIFSKPYLYNQLILVGRKGKKVKGLGISDLKGKRVGIIQNYAYGDLTNPKNNIILIKGKNNQQNLERLLSKQIDYMLVDKLLIQYMLKYQINDVTKHLEFNTSPLIVKSLHFAIKNDIVDGREIIARFDEEILKMMTDGSYNDILELNWIKSDIDGDGRYELVLHGDHAGIERPANTYSISAEKTFSPPINDSYRYIINGQSYDGWENIPDKYKIKISPGQADPNGVGLIFSF